MRRTTTLLFALITLFPATVISQTRKRTTTRPPARSATQRVSAAQREGAAHVAEHIKTLSRFLYLLGGVAKGLEGVDDAAMRNEASPGVIEQVKRNKATVRTSIRSVREGLDALEIEFRTTPELQRYYIKLAGVASGAATAEELAAANQFDRAGRKLLEVVNRLADVLVEMR